MEHDANCRHRQVVIEEGAGRAGYLLEILRESSLVCQQMRGPDLQLPRQVSDGERVVGWKPDDLRETDRPRAIKSVEDGPPAAGIPLNAVQELDGRRHHVRIRACANVRGAATANACSREAADGAKECAAALIYMRGGRARSVMNETEVLDAVAR